MTLVEDCKVKWSEVKVAQSCLTIWDPMDYTVLGILQARILEWVAFPFSRGSSQPRDWTRVSCIAGRFFTKNPKLSKKPPKTVKNTLSQTIRMNTTAIDFHRKSEIGLNSESKRKSGKFIGKVQSGWSLDEKLVRVSITDKGGGILAKTTESDSFWRQVRVIRYQMGGGEGWINDQRGDQISRFQESRETDLIGCLLKWGNAERKKNPPNQDLVEKSSEEPDFGQG